MKTAHPDTSKIRAFAASLVYVVLDNPIVASWIESAADFNEVIRTLLGDAHYHQVRSILFQPISEPFMSSGCKRHPIPATTAAGRGTTSTSAHVRRNV